MRLVTFEADRAPDADEDRFVAFGRIEGDWVIPMGSDLAAWLGATQALSPDHGRPEPFPLAPSPGPIPLAAVRLLAPVPAPGKVVCIGLNYRDHAQEAGLPLPTEPVLFAKFANSVIGPECPIIVPPAVRRVDYEAELGVVIGSRTRRVGVEQALDHVAGYLCSNDVSARDLQPKTGQWTRGKAVDTFLPIGPCLVTADEIVDPQALPIRCLVNGEVLQDSNTSEMIFGVAELVSFISQTMTLEPGDLIVTGTPAGVGFARDPRRWLEPGDTVTVEIGGIGSLRNAVERE